MQHIIKFRGFYLTICMAALVIAFAVYPPFRSNAQTTKPKASTKQQDTPSNKSAAPGKSDATYEEVKLEMKLAMQELEQAMQRLNKEDLPRMREEIRKTLQSINTQEMRNEIELAMKNVDMPAIQQEIQTAMKELQSSKMEAEVSKAMKELHLGLKEMQQINMEEVERSMKKVQEELERTNLNMEGIIQKAQKEMSQAKQQMELVSEGIDALEKDGLIKKTDNINIDWENDTLILNGVKQSRAISDKYRKYFGSGHFNYKKDKKQRSI